ncbi:hypothetical protein NMY22_g8713 [Coprinellus aureogranulatus]|nr:hypothetical protein NMY22_g8713 [Coprinellus aureogranulatus]
MVQFRKSPILLFVALFASANSRAISPGANSGLTVRDLLEHELFSRSLEDHSSLITRDDIEELFEAAHDYWQHMIRKAHIIVGKEEKKDELEFLPREEDKPKPITVESPFSTSWFGEALTAYRDAWLPKDHPKAKVDHSQLESRGEPEDISLWSRDWFNEWQENEERDWEDLDELD